MSNVFGNIRYLSSYKSEEEMKKDHNLAVDKVVMVDSGESLTWYIIRQVASPEDSIELENGLIAERVLTNNKMAEIESLTYTTESPVEVPVGGVVKGREFHQATLTDVLNALFYTSMAVKFSIDLHLTTLFYLKGEQIKLTDVGVYDIEGEGVSSAVLKINGKVLREDKLEPDSTEHHFLINKIIDETTIVEVELKSQNGPATVSEKIIFDNPVFWGIQSEEFQPNSVSVQRDFYRTVFENNEIELEVVGSNQCLFLTIEDKRKLEAVYDESGNLITDNFVDSGMIRMDFDGREENTMRYIVYQSNPFSIASTEPVYKIRVKVGDPV